MKTQKPIIVIDRETGKEFEEKILGEKYIRWAYQDSNSGLLHRIFFNKPLISSLMGWWYDSPFSKGKINSVINDLDINIDEIDSSIENFKSFNEFFIRKLKPQSRPYNDSPTVLVSPADGRVLVFPKLNEEQYFPVKGFPFSIKNLIPDHYDLFVNGSLAIIRLCPSDYHRYHFPCNGKIIGSNNYSGCLHTVNPIGLSCGIDVFGVNKRTATLIDTEAFGKICYIEVGAFGVGSIINNKVSGSVLKMEEKGYFKFGGSTIVLVFQKDKINFCNDLLKNTDNQRETLVKVGQDLAFKTME